MKKGLVSFEFLIPLSLVLIATGALIPSILQESRETVIQSSAKSLITSQLTSEQFQNPECQNPYISSYEVRHLDEVTELRFSISPPGCRIDPGETTAMIEEEICGAEPIEDNTIRCGDATYELMIN